MVPSKFPEGNPIDRARKFSTIDFEGGKHFDHTYINGWKDGLGNLKDEFHNDGNFAYLYEQEKTFLMIEESPLERSFSLGKAITATYDKETGKLKKAEFSVIAICAYAAEAGVQEAKDKFWEVWEMMTQKKVDFRVSIDLTNLIPGIIFFSANESGEVIEIKSGGIFSEEKEELDFGVAEGPWREWWGTTPLLDLPIEIVTEERGITLTVAGELLPWRVRVSGYFKGNFQDGVTGEGLKDVLNEVFPDIYFNEDDPDL